MLFLSTLKAAHDQTELDKTAFIFIDFIYEIGVEASADRFSGRTGRAAGAVSGARVEEVENWVIAPLRRILWRDGDLLALELVDVGQQLGHCGVLVFGDRVVDLDVAI